MKNKLMESILISFIDRVKFYILNQGYILRGLNIKINDLEIVPEDQYNSIDRRIFNKMNSLNENLIMRILPDNNNLKDYIYVEIRLIGVHSLYEDKDIYKLVKIGNGISFKKDNLDLCANIYINGVIKHIPRFLISLDDKIEINEYIMNIIKRDIELNGYNNIIYETVMDRLIKFRDSVFRLQTGYLNIINDVFISKSENNILNEKDINKINNKINYLLSIERTKVLTKKEMLNSSFFDEFNNYISGISVPLSEIASSYIFDSSNYNDLKCLNSLFSVFEALSMLRKMYDYKYNIEGLLSGELKMPDVVTCYALIEFTERLHDKINEIEDEITNNVKSK